MKEKRAFLEKDPVNDEWFDDFVYICHNELYNRGFKVVPFTDMISVPVYKESDIIIASVQATTDFFNKIDIEVPKYLGYPDTLKKYLKRDITKSNLNNNTKDYPFFIKPADDVKLFTGELIEKEESLKFMRDYCDLTNDMELYISDPINIVSEYRCFVHKKELKGIQYYAGDFRKYIDASLVEKMIRDYDSSPIAYTLDVGVNDKGETMLIEVNDMWAIGSYGMDYKIYTSMCVDRMNELKFG